MYRGLTFTDAFDRVKEKLDVPIMFTEFGADAYNAIELREDQISQARYLHANWRDIYEHAAGKGKTGVSIGGFTFQFTDGWWKYGQETNLDIHDNNASWANGGYVEDYEEGENNMNEEWFGICNKGPTDFRGLYEVYPRAAYYVLQDVHMLDVYDPSTTLEVIGKHFDAIELTPAMLNARSDNAMRITDVLSRIRVSNIRMEFETFNTDGSLISTPPDENPQEDYPSFLGFDHLQSFYTDFEIKPADNVTAKLSVNILGNVPVNPIDEVFYENRGRRENFVLDGEPLPMDDLERVKVYGASVSWEDRWFTLNGFYRVGHTHWGYEGDFFGIYRNAFYGENVDIYNGIAPIGVEISGKKDLEGFTVAYGPELWWGANPAILVKYQRTVASIDMTAFYQNEFAQRSESVSSFAVPLPATKRATFTMEKKWGLQDLGTIGIQVGGIWAGSTLKGRTFQIAEGPDDNVTVQQDKIKDEDTFGGKVKVTWQYGRWNWYAQYAYAGIVANGGPDETTTFTKWSLKDHGLGNGNQISSGIAVNLGNFQVAPNFMWQKPLVGPIPSNAEAPGRPRNVIDDPFAVRANREMIAGEIMFSHDPTPATWMWEWDNDIQEDAKLAWSIGYVFRHFPTTMDAAIGILQDGRTFFAFPGATPARDLWEVKARIVSKLSNDSRLVAHLLVGTGEPNGDDPRLIERYGGDLRVTYGSAALQTFVKVNDWGPYDYHRDFNLTFPVHLMGDLSYSLGTPRWFGLPQTRVGVKFTWRSLDEFSNRYCPTKTVGEGGELECDPEVPGFEDGTEWEIRTYLHIDLGM
jgi:hypothetical protein